MSLFNPAGEFPNPALYVGDLAPDVTEQHLFEMFSRVGPVASVRLCRDAATRKSLGYAYVNFVNAEHAEEALNNMNYEKIRGRPCRIMRSQRDPTKRKSQAGNVFIKPLPEDVDAKILYDKFSAFGHIESVKVPYKDDTPGGVLKARGYGFVQFSNPENAQAAIDSVKEINGTPVSVEHFKQRQARDPQRQTNVFVKNVPLNFTQQQFEALVADCGQFNSALLVQDQGTSKGFGYVNFLEPGDASRAIEKLNGMKLGDGAAAGDDASTQPPLFATFHKTRSVLARERAQQRAAGSSTRYPPGQNLYVKNLADDVDENTLKAEFSKYGNITSCVIRREPKSGVSLGFGFVCFEDQGQAEKALAGVPSGTIFHNKPLYVAMAQNKAQRAEFLRVQRLQFYQQQQQQFSMAQMQGYSGGYMGMPPRDYQGFPPGQFPANPTVPPANLVRGAGPPRGGFGVPYQGPQGAGRQGFPGQPYQQAGGQRGGRAAFPGGRGPPAGGNYPRGPQPGGPQQPGPQRGGGQWPAGQPAPGQIAMQQARPAGPPQQPAPQRTAAEDVARLSSLPPEQQKRQIGEMLYPKIANMLDANNKGRAGKITGMLLEALDNSELLGLAEEPKALEEKLSEALRVLNEAETTAGSQ